MKLTLGKMISALTSGSLTRLSRLDLPVRTSYEFSKTLKAIHGESVSYDERRQVILGKYGTPVEGTANFSIHDIPSFNRDIEELHAIEIELPGDLVKMSEVLSAKDGRLTTEDFNHLVDTFVNKDVP